MMKNQSRPPNIANSFTVQLLEVSILVENSVEEEVKFGIKVAVPCVSVLRSPTIYLLRIKLEAFTSNVGAIRTVKESFVGVVMILLGVENIVLLKINSVMINLSSCHIL